MLVACDIHPLNNTRVLKYLAREFATPDVERERWVRHWISEGFDALQDLLDSNPSTGTYCEGDTPSMADLCLVPQAYNARRFGLDVARWPTIARIEAACLALPAFDAARPEVQPDAPRA
jgi:maleylacetoacetate isomerase